VATCTETVRVAVAFEHPPVPVTVYVITDDPPLTVVITPDVALMVATPVLPDDHVPPLTVELNVVVPPKQTDVVPLSVPVDGGAVTVTVLVAVASAQPPVPATV